MNSLSYSNFLILLALVVLLSLGDSLRADEPANPETTPAKVQSADTVPANADAQDVTRKTNNDAKSAPNPDLERMKELVVKIEVTRRVYDIGRPWISKTSTSHGSGVMIGKGRILTNAHVVIYAKELRVEADRINRKVDAKVVCVSHELDLAVIEIDDDSVDWPSDYLEIADELPEQQKAVRVYGFPIGGESVSVTEGIVSRVEYSTAFYEGRLFRLQVDAALNPGNSGGPAIIDGRLYGLVTSGIRSADNIGYLISSWEIARFLERMQSAKASDEPIVLSDGKSLRNYTASMENSALRDFFDVPDDAQGRLVTTIRDAPDDYPLQVNDLLVAVAGFPIENDGNVRFEGRKLQYAGIARLLAKKDQIEFKVLRDGKMINVVVPLTDRKPRVLPYLKGKRTPYIVYGPLVFTPASQTLLSSLQSMASKTDSRSRSYASREISRMARSGHPLLTRGYDPQAFPGEQVVILSYKAKHRSMRGVPAVTMRPIKSVNGTKIKNLAHLAEVLRDVDQEHVQFAFDEKFAAPLIVNHKEMMRATSEVMEDNNIRRASSPDMRDAWSDPDE